MGRHRGSHGRRYARMVIARRHLTGFRVQGVYSPALMRALIKPGKGSDHDPFLWEDRETAERTASYWRDYPIEARGDECSFFGTMITDPPPLELENRGRTYYLAHLNSSRAIYSQQPPPAEPPSRQL